MWHFFPASENKKKSSSSWGREVAAQTWSWDEKQQHTQPCPELSWSLTRLPPRGRASPGWLTAGVCWVLLHLGNSSFYFLVFGGFFFFLLSKYRMLTSSFFLDGNFLWRPSSYPRASPMTQQVKESTCSAGDTGDACSIPGLGTSPGGENGNPLQYSCLENPMDRGAWWARVQRVAKSRTWLSTRMSVNCKRFVWGWAKTLRCRTLQALCLALPRQISPWSPPPEMHNEFSLDELGTSGVAGQPGSPFLPEPGQGSHFPGLHGALCWFHTSSAAPRPAASSKVLVGNWRTLGTEAHSPHIWNHLGSQAI